MNKSNNNNNNNNTLSIFYKKKSGALVRVHLSRWITLWFNQSHMSHCEDLLLTTKPQEFLIFIDWPLKDESWGDKLSAIFSNLMVLNLGSFVWKICILTTRPLLQKFSKHLLVFCPAEIELYFKCTSVL